MLRPDIFFPFNRDEDGLLEKVKSIYSTLISHINNTSDPHNAKSQIPVVYTGTTAPTSPKEGDIFFDTSAGSVKVYDSDVWTTLSISTTATDPNKLTLTAGLDASKPETGTSLALYLATDTHKLYAWNGSAYVFAGENTPDAITTIAYTSSSDFPTTGSTGSLYIARDTTKLYLWNGTAYAEVTKSSIGLGNVDNTSDADKPVSTAVQAELNNKANKFLLGSKLSWDNTTNPNTIVLSNLSKSDVGLGNVDNMSYEDIKSGILEETGTNMQYSTMPDADTHRGVVAQYVGETSSSFTKAVFYESVFGNSTKNGGVRGSYAKFYVYRNLFTVNEGDPDEQLDIPGGVVPTDFYLYIDTTDLASSGVIDSSRLFTDVTTGSTLSELVLNWYSGAFYGTAAASSVSPSVFNWAVTALSSTSISLTASLSGNTWVCSTLTSQSTNTTSYKYYWEPVTISKAEFNDSFRYPLEEVELETYVDYYGDDPELETAYSSSATYAKGDYCSYGSNNYVCKETISAAEAWTPSHWEQITWYVAVVKDGTINSIDLDKVSGVGPVYIELPERTIGYSRDFVIRVKEHSSYPYGVSFPTTGVTYTSGDNDVFNATEAGKIYLYTFFETTAGTLEVARSTSTVITPNS